MSITNYVFIIVGGFVAFLGLISLIFLSLRKIISSSGNKTIQSIVAIVIGLFFLIIGLIFNLPTNT